ncbi:DUF262 domain-containing protein [Mycolicibacterium porcinum]|uniref:DUF262 domain-containing protein n=1 Tax=Mycolicibacterium porcinum TaxID=39693 RepID=UPI0008489B9D|nr:DUF262 domain-containing protein [Mycolicibacterium porcinum]ODR23055.1 hypothetical protein BHQ19_18345 [Mycolicibacterium porcinum]
MTSSAEDRPLESGDIDDEENLSENEVEELDEASLDSYRVSYSGQDFDVDGLVRRLNKEDMLVPKFGHQDDRIKTAGFQRGFVWSKPQMDRFIESLLLGYPIPGILLVKQPDKRYLILDGQQRLRTLQRFYDGTHQDRPFVLQNVSRDYRGLRYSNLTEEQRRTIDNTYITATIVDTDGSAESQEAIYQIFERLNSGGTQLTAHEIRVALYAGPLIDRLHTLNHNPDWRSLYGNPSPRLRDQELVLRIIALFCNSDDYVRPLKRFLNRFVSENRVDTASKVDTAEALFAQAAKLVHDGPGPSALRRRAKQINVAQTDAVFVGLMRAMEQRDFTPEMVTEAVERIRHDGHLDQAMTTGTSNEESVSVRLAAATEAFFSV